MTHRFFSRLSRHLIFADFHFHPYATSGLTLLLPPVVKIERARERMDFWTSNDIAPLVRSCTIEPWSSDSTPRNHTHTPYILLTPFFERLARFIGLQRLYAHQVHFTQMAVDNLCRLPALTHLHLTGCGVVPEAHIDPSSLELRVSGFKFIRRDFQDDGITLWIPLLHPDHLRELDVICVPRFLDTIIPTIPQFHRVHTLSLTVDVSKTSHNLTMLSKFPAVEVLSLSGPWKNGESEKEVLEAADILPMLREYKGYFRSLPAFLALPNISRLEAYEPFGTYASPAHFMRQLTGLPSPSNITALNLRFNTFDYAALAPISTFFARLTQLYIAVRVEDVQLSADRVNRQATTFFCALADGPTVPCTLERLVISWNFVSEEYDEMRASHPTGDDIPDLANLREALMARCPGLTFLTQDGHDFMLHWRTSPAGTIDHTAKNMREAVTIRTKLFELLETL